MRSQVGPASRELVSVEDFKKFTQVPEVSVIGFFEKESDLKAVFLSYADSMREKIRFAHTSNPELLAAEEQTYDSHL